MSVDSNSFDGQLAVDQTVIYQVVYTVLDSSSIAPILINSATISGDAMTDDDGDGYLDEDEIACDSDPLDFISRPKDFDRDQLPDCTDPDDDNDGCPDTEDAFPLDPRECKDTDGDGIGDNKDCE